MLGQPFIERTNGPHFRCHSNPTRGPERGTMVFSALVFSHLTGYKEKPTYEAVEKAIKIPSTFPAYKCLVFREHFSFQESRYTKQTLLAQDST